MGGVVIVIVIVVIVIVTGGKQSQLLALALGLGWSLTKVNSNPWSQSDFYDGTLSAPPPDFKCYLRRQI